MNFPPSSIRIRVIEHGKRQFSLWLPALILWPLFILVAIMAIPVIVIAALFLIWTRQGRARLAALGGIYELLCALRGLNIDVHTGDEVVLIKVV